MKEDITEDVAPADFEGEADSLTVSDFYADGMELYPKRSATRQEIVFFDGYETTLEDEFRSLERLYTQNPDYFPRPGFYADTGEESLYFVERMHHEPFNLYFQHPERLGRLDSQELLAHLHRFGESMKENREPHGDLRGDNLLIDQEADIVAIDPVGFPEDLSELPFQAGDIERMLVNWDIQDLNLLIRKTANRTGAEFEEDYLLEPLD